MVDAKVVKGLAERLAKAQELVAAGAVFPVAGLSGYFTVVNGDGTQHYLVCTEAGHESCTCPDFRQRQQAAGLPCKHILASQLSQASAAAHTATKPAPVPARPAVDEALMDEVLFGKVA